MAFIRNFDTKDSENDIALEEGVEMEYNLVGFYRAHDSKTGVVSQIGQSSGQAILMGANAMTSSLLLAASALIALSAF